ncbi:MAG: hydrogenase maturation protease [Deltaproteobacteria bacterium]|nr:hydrogenase maturation protease [Deltaproteobacteria bacterium]
MVQTRIIALGNRLRGDDAAGLLAADRLANTPIPAGAEVIEGPEDPVRLLDLLDGVDRIVILDAADMGLEPGSIRVLRDEADWANVRRHQSVHAVGIQDLVAMARKFGITSQVTLVAIQAASWKMGEGLSPAVMDALDRFKEIALKEASNEV